MWGRAEVHRLDGQLAALARVDAALRLGLGQALELLGQGAHCHALGFSSLAAYSLERGERSGRWAEGARGLARRLEGLPVLRRALASGQLSWSAVELVARVALPESEASWLEMAAARTVRELRQLVGEAETRRKEAAGAEPAGNQVGGVESGSVESCSVQSRNDQAEPSRPAAIPSCDEDEVCTLTCTVDREEAWLFEATRSLLQHLGERTADEQVQALLAEGQITLLAGLPRGTLDVDAFGSWDPAQQRWNEQLKRWQQEAEELCEARIRATGLEREAALPGGAALPFGVALPSDAELPSEALLEAVRAAAALGCSSLEGLSALELDRRVRELSAGLCQQELQLSQCLLEFHRADGWRVLGFATEGQYARERLGISRSSLVARRVLGLRLEALPLVARALGSGQLGVEAALQLVRIATPRSERAWVARARQRTIKHLREEVSAALIAVRLSGEVDCLPPVDAELEVFCELERAVLSGQVCREHGERRERSAARGGRALEEPSSVSRRAWLVMLASLEQWLQSGLESRMASGLDARIQMSAGRRRPGQSAGRVTLRLRVSRDTYVWWRGLEAQTRRWLPRGMSWLKFLCLSLWRGWRHLFGRDVAYGGIYVRDRYCCRSPVCSRQDVTPHHLVFRSAGGGDEASNITTVCSWCHLLGIHGGRIRAQGTAELIHWELGAPEHPCLVVHGRERMAA